jgi:hypothetical protein
MELNVQTYLRAGNSVHSLESKGIYAKAHKLYPQIISLNYDQIEVQDSDPIAYECRALILDSDKNWEVIARGYDRFFNYGQGCAAEINWSQSKVYMKLDGSYCGLYWNPYENNWNVGTRGTPDASGEVNGFSQTFQRLFWETFNELGYTLPQHTNYTLMFELMRPENRVVCRYPTHRLVLHGMRDIHTGQELNYDQIKAFGFLHNYEVVKALDLKSIDDVIKSCESINPLDEEGYVVCDQITFNRVKVKSPQYLALHSMRDGFGPRRVVTMIRENSGSQWLEYFPEFTDLYNQFNEKYLTLVSELNYVYSLYKDIQDQKTFAITVTNVLKGKNIPFSGALFSLRAGKTPDIKTYLKNINIQSLLDYFE